MNLVGWDVTGLADLQQYVQALAAPFPAEAHEAAGAVIQEVWQAAATGTVIPPLAAPYTNEKLAASVQVQVSGDGATISADPAQMPEGGIAPRNMKPGLLHGPHSRLGQHGRYNIIPMHHDAASLPSSVVRQLVQGGAVTSLEGIRSKILNGGQPVLAYHAGSGTFQVVSHYTWRTGLYTGMRLGMHKDYSSGPVTFRTVSERSPAASWWYPAKAGIPLMQAVEQAGVPLAESVYVGWWEARCDD